VWTVESDMVCGEVDRCARCGGAASERVLAGRTTSRAEERRREGSCAREGDEGQRVRAISGTVEGRTRRGDIH